MKNDSFKIILIVVIIAVAGVFLYKNFAKNDAGQQGAVISGTSTIKKDPGYMICEPNPAGVYGSGTLGDSCLIIASGTCIESHGTYKTTYDASGNASTSCVPNTSIQNGTGATSTGILQPATTTTTVKTTTIKK